MKSVELFMYLVSIGSIIGNIYVVKKSRWGFLIWAISNCFWIVYDVYKTAYPQAVLFLIYLGMTIWGFMVWRKEEDGFKADSFKADSIVLEGQMVFYRVNSDNDVAIPKDMKVTTDRGSYQTEIGTVLRKEDNYVVMRMKKV